MWKKKEDDEPQKVDDTNESTFVSISLSTEASTEAKHRLEELHSKQLDLGTRGPKRQRRNTTSNMNSDKRISGFRNSNRVIEEILATERDYVLDLGVLVDVYLNRIRADKILTEEELKKVFCNIEEIQEVNKKFLASLDRAPLSRASLAERFLDAVCVLVVCFERLYCSCSVLKFY